MKKTVIIAALVILTTIVSSCEERYAEPVYDTNMAAPATGGGSGDDGDDPDVG